MESYLYLKSPFCYDIAHPIPRCSRRSKQGDYTVGEDLYGSPGNSAFSRGWTPPAHHHFYYILKTNAGEPECKLWGKRRYHLMEGTAKSPCKWASTQEVEDRDPLFFCHRPYTVRLRLAFSHADSGSCCNEVAWRAGPLLATRMRTWTGRQ